MKSPTKELSYFSTEYPTFYKDAKLLMNSFDPTFEFTNITVNKNLACKPHRDKGNHGESWIIGLGNYNGGTLSVLRNKTVLKFDVKNNFVKFNGKLETHWTDEFSGGNRYTLVFYKSEWQQSGNHKVTKNTTELTSSREDVMSRLHALKERYKKKG